VYAQTRKHSHVYFPHFNLLAFIILFQVEVIPGQSLIDSLTPFLTQNGVAPIQVEIFLENSRTPVPTLSEARFLVGQRLNVKCECKKLSK
jgi:hypothetical protein